jgi:hypothetical protein
MSDEPASATMVTLKIAESEFTKHAADVGHVAIAWNNLQDTLCSIFAIIAMPDTQPTAWAVWHAVRSDRNQRDMLEAAARTKLTVGSNLYKEIKWALGTLNGLEDDRNTAIHSPYGLIVEHGQLVTIPVWFTNNPRAAKLRDRDLAAELRSYKTNLDALNRFLMRIEAQIRDPASAQPLLPRPAMPRPAHSNPHSPSSGKKGRPPRPRS